MRKWVVLTVLALSGCASTEADYYGTIPTTPVAPNDSVSQALADCRAKSDAMLASPNALANPFFAAAAQQQYVNDCMAAKGYRSR